MKLKWLLALIILILPFFSVKTVVANAEEASYLRVVKEGVYFYETPNKESSLFELPYSYYLKKIGTVGDYYRVECFGSGTLSPMLDGYVLISEVDFSDPVTDPFLNFTVTTCDSAVLYADKTLQQPEVLIFKNRTLGYYGKAYSTNNEIIYMVTYNHKIGYVKEEALVPFNVPLHDLPVFDKLPEVNQLTEPTTLSKGDNVLKILVIVALIASAIIIIGLIVLPDKKEKRLLKNERLDD